MAGYVSVGCKTAAESSWPDAPDDAFIFGLKELADDGPALRHRHIMFGHAYKGQSAGRRLLDRFKAGGGALFDLEYLTDTSGRRIAAFGYWAGFAGAAVSVRAWAAQKDGGICPPVTTAPSARALTEELRRQLNGRRPDALIIGALGRVGTGAADLLTALDLPVTRWDMAETASGGPFPEILAHQMFFNCILARPGTPVFVPPSALAAPRDLCVIGDIACDPDSTFNPIPLYSRATTWQAPANRLHAGPPLDLIAIDNLPSLLPLESSEDFAAQLLPHLETLDRPGEGVWGRAASIFREQL